LTVCRGEQTSPRAGRRLGSRPAARLCARQTQRSETGTRSGPGPQPELGDYYLDSLTSADLSKRRDAIPGKRATVNSKLRVLKTLLREAVHDKEPST
jgi:hypothetical protein